MGVLIVWGVLIVGFVLYCAFSEPAPYREPSARKRTRQMRREARRAVRRVDRLAAEGQREMLRISEQAARSTYATPPVYRDWTDAAQPTGKPTSPFRDAS